MRAAAFLLSRVAVGTVVALVVATLAFALAVERAPAQVVSGTPHANSAERPRAQTASQRERRRSERRPSAEAKSKGGGRAADPFSAMGGRSPFCSSGQLEERERSNCRSSGSLSHPHRIDHYAYDIHIDTGADNIAGNVVYGIQAFASYLWIGFLYLLKGCLLLLEWAFSLDLLSDTLSAVRRGLQRLHRNGLGEPWFLAAIAAAGVWGIYRGFIQGRRMQAFAGLAATVTLMSCALLIINRPVQTVGYASQLANEASLSMVSGASTGTLDRPARSYGKASSRLFDHLVLRPWCALEFGDTDFCLANPRKVVAAGDVPDDDDIKEAWKSAPTVADWWLRFEPNGEDDEDQRNRIYEKWRNKDGHRLQDVVRIQKQGGTATRLALLALIVVGLLGAVLMLGWLALKLLGYGVLTVLLVLFAPIAFLAPALGDSGRATFMAWGKRLLGCLVAKAVYAIFLAVVLVAAAALAEAYTLGWIAAWGLQIIFWWAIFLKRDDLLQFVTAPLPDAAKDAAGRGGIIRTLQTAHYAKQASAAAAGAGAAVGAVAAAPLVRPAKTALQSAGDWKHAKTAATQTVAENAIRRQGRDQLARRHDEAETLLERDRTVRDQLDRVNHGLRKYDEAAELAAARGEQPPEPTDKERALLDRRVALQHQRPAVQDVRAAQEQLRHAEVNHARTGEPITARDEEAWIAQRRRDHANPDLPLDHERNLRTAGIDPARYRDASPGEQTRLRAQVERALDDERKRLAAVPAPDQPAPSQPELRRARDTIDRQELKEARSQEFQARRRERRAQRSRGHVSPPLRQKP